MVYFVDRSRVSDWSSPTTEFTFIHYFLVVYDPP